MAELAKVKGVTGVYLANVVVQATRARVSANVDDAMLVDSARARASSRKRVGSGRPKSNYKLTPKPKPKPKTLCHLHAPERLYVISTPLSASIPAAVGLNSDPFNCSTSVAPDYFHRVHMANLGGQ